MSEFTYDAYQAARSAAQSRQTGTKVGFFKLAEGEEALVRIFCSSVNDLHFASIHRPVFGKKYEGLSNPYAGISCLKTINNFGQATGECLLCKAAEEPDAVVGKAKKVVYVKMLVSYKNADGSYAAPIPVVWERPAGFATELASQLADYGDLKQVLLKISRMGSGTETRYILKYARPEIYKPEMIPADFSAFDNFDVSKHSYWKKTEEEIKHFLATGTFPVEQATTVEQPTIAVKEANTTPIVQATKYVPAETPVVEKPVEEKHEERPVRNFGSFSF